MDKLSDIGTIKRMLTKYGFNFSKTLGQNFLINPSVCPKMAESCGIEENTGVLEVGPGIGVLTCELAKRAKKVVAVELDNLLLPVLNETLSEFENVKIINNDVMQMDLKKLLSEEFFGMNVVFCANLPYYITSPILMKLLEERLNLKAITVMVQKEAAQRICAGVGNRKSGSISLAVNYYAEPEILFFVKSGSFIPAPKVDSSVIRLNIRKNPACEVFNEKLLFRIIKVSFLQRRKTVINALSNNLNLPKETLLQAFDELEIDLKSRAENLTLEQFAILTNFLYENGLV